MDYVPVLASLIYTRPMTKRDDIKRMLDQGYADITVMQCTRCTDEELEAVKRGDPEPKLKAAKLDDVQG